jgi:hypothetical protein
MDTAEHAPVTITASIVTMAATNAPVPDGGAAAARGSFG